jgi:hypothetical protein
MSTSRLPIPATACALLAAAAALLSTRCADAAAATEPGSLVAVSVSIDGQRAPLYPAPDGTGRFYVEARPGSRYSLTLRNRTGERIGAVLAVDGLNVISGSRDAGRGRMYVLDPWQETTVQGWRTSLDEVRRFRFVDEQLSYAARSGKANGRMGWIELAVYRERRPEPVREREEASDRVSSAPAGGAPAAPSAEARAKGFPGTGWGERARDEVVLVSFEPEASACERIVLRYEYRPALVALGVLAPARPPHDRLQQRERGETGFAAPPSW